MPHPFPELRERLLRAGIAPRHVRRYLTELGEHLADLTAEEQRAGLSAQEAQSTAIQRLGTTEDLARAMLRQRRLYSWSSRAPWAVYALVPLLVLALARLAALLILWSGWQLFLPGTDTPFGAQHVSWLGNAYFQFGRMIYFGAPFAIGWALCTLAARQRLRTWWLSVGMCMVACIAATQRVDASRSAISGFGHIHIGFALGPSVQGVANNLLYAAVVFALSLLPYLVWRWHEARSASA